MSGSIYESVLPLRSSVSEAEAVQALPRSLCLSLPLGEQELTSGAAVVLDEAHAAVVGFPHPSAGAGKGDPYYYQYIVFLMFCILINQCES